MNRDKISEYMQDAIRISRKSKCLRRHVGAVVVKNGSGQIAGYNNVICGDCSENGCMRTELGVPSGERHELCRAIHAEQMIISLAAKYGISLQGTDLFVTCLPCSICARMIVGSGISRVYYCEDYPDAEAKMILESNGVILEKVEV